MMAMRSHLVKILSTKCNTKSSTSMFILHAYELVRRVWYNFCTTTIKWFENNISKYNKENMVEY